MQLWNVGTETPSGRLSRGKKNWQPRYCHEPWQRESMSTNLFHFYFPAILLGQPLAFSAPRVISMAELSEKATSRFSIEKESIEIVGFYSSNQQGILTPQDSPFH